MADTDYDLHTIDVLNRLYARHRRSLLPRLREMHHFISRASAADVGRVSRLVTEFAEDEAWLARAIVEAGGGVYPSGADIRTSSLHYLDLRSVLPLVERDLRALLSEFEQAQSDPYLTNGGREVIAQVGARLRRQFDEFAGMRTRIVPS